MQLPCFSSKCYTALPRPSSLLASCWSWHSLAARKESRVQARSYFMYNWNAWAEWARSSLERTGQEFCQDLALTKPSLIFTVFTTVFVVPQIGIIPFVNISSSTAAKDFLELQRPILITLPILPQVSEKLQGSPNWAARRAFFPALSSPETPICISFHDLNPSNIFSQITLASVGLQRKNFPPLARDIRMDVAVMAAVSW